MHITEGMLPVGYALAYGAGAAVCAGKGIYNYYKESKKRPMYKQLTGVFTADIFIISLLPIPEPAGTPREIFAEPSAIRRAKLRMPRIGHLMEILKRGPLRSKRHTGNNCPGAAGIEAFGKVKIT